LYVQFVGGVGLRMWEEYYVIVRVRLSVGRFGRMRRGVPVVNQSVHWVMVSGLLFLNEQSVVVVGLDVQLSVHTGLVVRLC
jgi:hypothetical protein